MASIRTPADYEQCLLELLRAHGGRASRGQVLRDFERRYLSSIPHDAQTPSGPHGDGPPRWQRSVVAAQQRLLRRGIVHGADPDLWELP